LKVSVGTRLEPGLRQRLRMFAAATDQTMEDVVAAALDGYLPPIPAEMTKAQHIGAALDSLAETGEGGSE
jgi:hypothetical protein